MEYFVLVSRISNEHTVHVEELSLIRLTRYGSGTISDTTPSQRNAAAARKTVNPRPSIPELVPLVLKSRIWRTKAIGTAPAAHDANLKLARASGAPPVGEAMFVEEDFV